MTHSEDLSDIRSVLATIESYFLIKSTESALTEEEKSLMDIVGEAERKVSNLLIWGKS